VDVLLQPASRVAANNVPNDASFQGMKPPFFQKLSRDRATAILVFGFKAGAITLPSIWTSGEFA
jgi:hypothetical protein